MRAKKSIMISAATALLLLQSNLGTSLSLSLVHATETPAVSVPSEPLDNIGFSAIPVHNAWDYSVWSNHTDGNRVGSLEDARNQQLNVTRQIQVAGISMVYFESPAISGWVAESALHFGGNAANLTATPVENAWDFGIWSHFAQGSQLDSLQSYQGQQVFVALEAPNGWVLIKSGDSEIGWIHKSGLSFQAPLLAETKEETRTEAIAFQTVYVNDSTLPEGEEVVTQEGEAGELAILEEVTYTDGVATKRQEISRSATKNPVNQKVSLGSKPGPGLVVREESYELVLHHDQEFIHDATLPIGESYIQQAGVDGQSRHTDKVTYTDGQETNRESVSSLILKEPIPEIQVIGTATTGP